MKTPPCLNNKTSSELRTFDPYRLTVAELVVIAQYAAHREIEDREFDSKVAKGEKLPHKELEKAHDDWEHEVGEMEEQQAKLQKDADEKIAELEKKIAELEELIKVSSELTA